ncbi:YwbE family protein [Proteocatella sphenisci]|uniref:YwbE family protein n=1 Tax=Proteocatella sphenisci TaxID=181070 RepID=UPI0004B0236B|nr:YwbE family protein [Proteocatella sphenisci]
MKRKTGDIMDGTVRSNIKIGTKVMVVQKQDQRTGKLTEGTVMRLLTNSSNHHRGIKVMLAGGIVGRVQRICDPDGIKK